ncbi:hypothetical protein A3J44_06165 [candidate division WOR-1 bacterium RIFCSPHIGHO2_02_FULL_45_12]|nr:MAG: hypothetical protein A3J44_06165 [candidate division WOR-1 bacterium RIFCSPHIGHO2_02_FULL_45_12]
MPGSSAFLLAAGTKISAKSHLAVMIPKGQASLNNSGGDAVRLFDSNSALRLKVSYEGTVKEGYAYAKDQTGKWVWSDQPTPGALNIIAQIVSYPSTLIFSEVLPNPEGDDAEGEFMEIFNTGSDSIDLADWSVSDGRRKYQISEDDFLDTELAGQKYLVLYREVTGISLNNTGEEQLELYNPLGEKVDTLVLDASGKEAEAYAWDGQGFAWTEKPTPGAKNKFSSTSEKKTVEKKIITPQTKTVILKNIREQELGSVIKTSGTVSVEPDVLGEGVLYLAGSGIRVVLPKNFDGTLEPGQFLELTGVLSSFHNELQLKVQNPADITVTEDLRELNTHEIKTGDVAEATEGFLVTVSGNLTENAGDNFVLDDGSGPAKVHLMESAGINKPKMKKGELLTVTGLVSQYDENFRILPRYQSDIVTGQGQVAGISAGGPSLPRTGTDFWLIVAVFSGFCYNLLLLTRKES